MAHHHVARHARSSLAALCLLASSGCTFATGFNEGVVWLPDSSGLVFAVPGHHTQLFLFDIATRKHRVLIDDTDTWTNWPAVSPDGKQVAVARLDYLKGKPGTLRLIRYDLDGKEVARSPALPWTKMHSDLEEKNETWLGWAGLFWAPNGRKVIVTDYSNSVDSATAILDLGNDRLMQLEGWPLVFAGTPIRPDGKAFLIRKSHHLAVVDWQGREERIALPDDTEASWRSLIFGHEATTRWDGNTAVAIGRSRELRIDTVKRTVAVAPKREFAKGEWLQSEYVFPQSGAAVRLVAGDSPNVNVKLLLHKPGVAEAQELAKGPYAFFPAPNGKWLAVRGVLGAVTQPVRVIGIEGEIIAELPQHLEK